MTQQVVVDPTLAQRLRWHRQDDHVGGGHRASHEEVAQPSMVLLRIRNSGLGSIRRADVRRPLTFTFPGRVVKEFTVTDCRGVSRRRKAQPRH